jgi:hypothetical protein
MRPFAIPRQVMGRSHRSRWAGLTIGSIDRTASVHRSTMNTTHPQGSPSNKCYNSNKFRHESPCFSTASGTGKPSTETRPAAFGRLSSVQLSSISGPRTAGGCFSIRAFRCPSRLRKTAGRRSRESEENYLMGHIRGEPGGRERVHAKRVKPRQLKVIFCNRGQCCMWRAHFSARRDRRSRKAAPDAAFRDRSRPFRGRPDGPSRHFGEDFANSPC